MTVLTTSLPHPPFGENIYYADLNFLVEAWHRVLATNAEPEAIVDRAKDKSLTDYQRLMQQCFEEYCRVLKPGRWMTVVFHNSRNAVWNAIQEAMLAAGFVVADVRTLEQTARSYWQSNQYGCETVPRLLLFIKPNGGLENRFHLEAGAEEGVYGILFVRICSNCPSLLSRMAERRLSRNGRIICSSIAW